MPEINKVAYGLTIGDLQYGNSRPGVVEATLKPGETLEEALDELDERLVKWHKKRYPHLYQDEYGISNPPVGKVSYTKESIVSPAIQVDFSNGYKQTEEGIKAATSLDQLTSYKLLASQDKELYALYMLRLKQLTNAEVR